MDSFYRYSLTLFVILVLGLASITGSLAHEFNENRQGQIKSGAADSLTLDNEVKDTREAKKELLLATH